MRITRYIIYTIITISLISCAKETPEKDEVTTGLICAEGDEKRFSDWCIDNELNYHLGHPNILCFDSMLVAMPLLNSESKIYGNYPLRYDPFTTMWDDLPGIRFENDDCEEGGERLTYQMWVTKADIASPDEVTVKFYFYEDGPFPSDSMDVLFYPWNF